MLRDICCSFCYRVSVYRRIYLESDWPWSHITSCSSYRLTPTLRNNDKERREDTPGSHLLTVHCRSVPGYLKVSSVPTADTSQPPRSVYVVSWLDLDSWETAWEILPRRATRCGNGTAIHLWANACQHDATVTAERGDYHKAEWVREGRRTRIFSGIELYYEMTIAPNLDDVATLWIVSVYDCSIPGTWPFM
jgi:hypothetical protein